MKRHNPRRTSRIIRYFVMSIAVLSLVSSSYARVFAASCANGISQLDCEAILNGWVDWVPGTCSSNTTGTLNGNDNAQKLFNYFTQHGYSKEQAAGIVGNTSHESGNLPERLQGTPPTKITPYGTLTPGQLSSTGWGLTQWTPASKVGDYTSKTNEDPDSLDTQIEYLWKQLEGTSPVHSEKGAGNALKNVTALGDTGARQAADAFEDSYERPFKPNPSNDPSGYQQYLQNRMDRENTAIEALHTFGPGAPVGSGSSPSSPACGGSTTAGRCTNPTPNGYSNIKQALHDTYKIDLTGATDDTEAARVFATICTLASAPTYYSRLTARGPITIDFVAGNPGVGNGGCGGWAKTIDLVEFYGPFCSGKDPDRYVLSHELGHIFEARNQSIGSAFNSGPWTTVGRKLPDWNCAIHNIPGTDYQKECFASMIGTYLVWYEYRVVIGGGPPGPINTNGVPYLPDYATNPTYDAYWNFAKDNLFGGVVFNSF